MKVFSAKFASVASFGVTKVSYLQSFLCENHIFHQFANFSPSKVFRYTVVLFPKSFKAFCCASKYRLQKWLWYPLLTTLSNFWKAQVKFTTSQATQNLETRTAWGYSITSLVPRPFPPPVFDHLRNAKFKGKGLGNLVICTIHVHVIYQVDRV